MTPAGAPFRPRSAWRRGIVVLGAAALAGCVTAPSPLRPTDRETLRDDAFEVSGRLSARRGSEGAAASFRWTHRPERDELLLSTPLGSTLARLEGGAGDVRLELPDGRVSRATDWEALTANVLGAPLPVRGLAWWVQGIPHPGSAHAIERDAVQRASVLRQDGWEIVYGYKDDSLRPSRLRLAYPDTEIRLVLDNWTDPVR